MVKKFSPDLTLKQRREQMAIEIHNNPAISNQELCEMFGIASRTVTRERSNEIVVKTLEKFRKRDEITVSAKLYAKVDDAIRVLEEILLDDTLSERTRLDAAKYIIDNSMDKTQKMDVNVNQKDNQLRDAVLTNEDAKEAVKKLLASKD